jgi:hypothetical protein
MLKYLLRIILVRMYNYILCTQQAKQFNSNKSARHLNLDKYNSCVNIEIHFIFNYSTYYNLNNKFFLNLNRNKLIVSKFQVHFN